MAAWFGRRRVVFAIIPLWAAMAGCSEQDEIRRYTVARQAAPEQTAAPESEAAPSRMLAAIVPHGSQGWFFKLTGEPQATQDQTENFVAYLRSLKFDAADDATPTWKLPEGWTQLPGSELRFATIRIIAPGAPLELTVIPLPLGDKFDDAYVLSNVNRWREQLALMPLEPSQLDDELLRLELENDHRAVYVNLLGKMKPTSMGRPPFAGGAGPFAGGANAGGTKRSPPPVARDPDADDADFRYETPAGWKKSEGSSLSKVAFQAEEDGRKVEITVTGLAAAAGDVASNVNRWRQQIQLKPLDADELGKQVEKIMLGDVAGSYVALVGPEEAKPREAIYGVIAVHKDAAWFIKLKGDVQLAEKQKQAFESFVRSIRF